MMKRILPALLLFAALSVRADLVAQYTFARENLLEAKVGTDAKEATGKNPVALADAASNLTRVEDTAVLGDRTGVVSIPVGAGLAVPVPAGTGDWALLLSYYAPTEASWRCFFTRSQNNTSDGSLFVRGNTEVGQGGYTGVGSVVGEWHQVVVSHSGSTSTVWHDATKIGKTWNWSLSGLDWLYVSLDESAEDGLTYFDEVRLYDEAKPADLFPDGASDPAIVETDRDEPDGNAPAVFFF